MGTPTRMPALLDLARAILPAVSQLRGGPGVFAGIMKKLLTLCTILATAALVAIPNTIVAADEKPKRPKADGPPAVPRRD
jgi:hypothetical protein